MKVQQFYALQGEPGTKSHICLMKAINFVGRKELTRSHLKIRIIFFFLSSTCDGISTEILTVVKLSNGIFK